jgi:hypothetical protein
VNEEPVRQSPNGKHKEQEEKPTAAMPRATATGRVIARRSPVRLAIRIISRWWVD